MPFTILRQDITKIRADAIVNAANTNLQMGGGVSGAIFKGAGAIQLQKACDKLSPIKMGEAVITPGFALPAKFIIHAAGPVYGQGDKQESERLLCAAYRNSLKRAIENDCETIAFSLISSGMYGYPKDEALKVASSVIHDFLKDHDLHIILAVYDKTAFSLSRELLGSVKSYIDEHYVESQDIRRSQLLDVEREALYQTYGDATKHNEPVLEKMFSPSVGAPASLDDLIGNLDEPFSQMLFRLIVAKKMTNVDVYKGANLDRKLFSKIMNNKGYMPSKRTALALAIALKLSLEETDDFLERAGYALSHAVKFDVIIEYFITKGRYDIFEINELLFEYDQPLLGG